MNIEDHKITFINRNDEYHTTQITISSDAVLPDVIEAFELFLRGSGYHFKGTVGIVDDSESVVMPQIKIDLGNFKGLDDEPIKKCPTCKHDSFSPNDEPCTKCYYTGLGYSNWEPKEQVESEQPRKLCRTCEYVLNNIRKEPCRSCFSDNFNNWQPKQ